MRAGDRNSGLIPTYDVATLRLTVFAEPPRPVLSLSNEPPRKSKLDREWFEPRSAPRGGQIRALVRGLAADLTRTRLSR